MIDSRITRMVLGPARTLTLGGAVGQSIEPPSSAALRWSEGRWVQEGAPRLTWLARMRSALKRSATLLARSHRLHLRHRPGVAVLALGTVLLVGGLGVAWRAPRGPVHNPGGLPVAALSNVRVLPSSYVPPAAPPAPALQAQAAQDRERRGAIAPLPFTAPMGRAPVAPHKAGAPAPARQAARPPGPGGASAARPAAAAPSAAVSVREQGRGVPAVVLDEAMPRPVRAPVLSSTAEGAAAASQEALAQRPAPAAPAVAAAAAAAATPASASAGPHALPAAAELIAISPDGRLAVFSDPQTRMPQPFQLGEQLPGGDTVRAIDAKAGKVRSSKREYSLD